MMASCPRSCQPVSPGNFRITSRILMTLGNHIYRLVGVRKPTGLCLSVCAHKQPDNRRTDYHEIYYWAVLLIFPTHSALFKIGQKL
jgi:hypothetical protein